MLPMPQIARSLAPVLRRLWEIDDTVIDDQIAIAGISAPTGAESRRARWVATELARRGVRNVRIDDAGNVVGWTGPSSTEPPVVICAHLDTAIEPREPVVVRRDGPKLRAPGISDNARGLTTMLALSRPLAAGDVSLSRPVLLAATTGEEGRGNLRGARHLFDTAGRGAWAAIALDGPGDEAIVNTASGARRFHVTFRGAGGHSWGAYGSPNAVHAAADFVMRLTGLASAAGPRSALTASRIAGGEALNAIPADAWVEIDLRSTDPDVLMRLDRELQFAARAAAEAQNAARLAHSVPLGVSVELIGDRPAGEVPETESIVSAAVAATRQVGREPRLTLASTDANIPISLGIPAIAIGGGGVGGDTHTHDEWYENVEGPRGIARALLTLAAVAA